MGKSNKKYHTRGAISDNQFPLIKELLIFLIKYFAVVRLKYSQFQLMKGNQPPHLVIK